VTTTLRKRRLVLSNQEAKTLKGLLLDLRYWVIDDQELKVYFVIPRKLGSSVARNRIKRRLKEIIRLDKNTLQPGFYLLRVKECALDASYNELREEFVNFKVKLNCRD
jgi:ribonuclease P protein component